MRRAVAVVGLGFGDESKGALVDFLSAQLDSDLTVRYSGGSQAAHSVLDAKGRRHIFAQWGAGTFHGCRTHLDQEMIIHPEAMVPEAAHLESLGIKQPWSLLTVHPDCPVTTRFHAHFNQVVETTRGAKRHGSCGHGIGVVRSLLGDETVPTIYAKDLVNRAVLRNKLQRFKEYIEDIYASMHDTPIPKLPDTDDVLNKLLAVGTLRLQLRDTLPESIVTIFEGAQGILLDEHYGGWPHTTWSTVTPSRAVELAGHLDEDDFHIIGCVRAFYTRHGAGPFPSYNEELTDEFGDPGNPENPWQGKIRVGFFDVPLFEYAKHVCSLTSQGRQLSAIAISHLDQFNKRWLGTAHVSGYDARSQTPLGLLLKAEQTLGRAGMETREAVFSRALGDLLPRVKAIHTSPDDPQLDEVLADEAALITSHGPNRCDRKVVHDGQGVLRRLGIRCSPLA